MTEEFERTSSAQKLSSAVESDHRHFRSGIVWSKALSGTVWASEQDHFERTPQPPRLRSRSKSPLIRPSQTSGTSDQTVPDRSDLWSDDYALEDHCALDVRSKPPLIRRVPDRSDPWSDKFQTIVQTSSRPLSRLECARNTVPDYSAVEITSDQTKVRSKLPLFRLKCVRNSLIREWFWTWTNLSISL